MTPYAMVLEKPKTPLVRREMPLREPAAGEVRVRVHACGVCRTDLHVCDGELPGAPARIVPGHEVIGVVDAAGTGVGLALGARVGVPWLGHTCGQCRFCLARRENLCDRAEFTGFTRDGGFATHVIADAAYCFPIPAALGDVEAAPLMCAGLIGYRAYRMLPADARSIGLVGFGAAAHILTQLAVHDEKRVFAFTRAGDVDAQAFARSLGAVWAGASDADTPELLDALIILAPVGPLVPWALSSTVKGGVVVCAGIHMSDIPSFPYSLLWGERVVRSVANLTRDDGAFLALAPRIPIHTTTRAYPLLDANRALDDLKNGRLNGAAVLVPDER